MLIWIIGLFLLFTPSSLAAGVGMVSPVLDANRPLYVYAAPSSPGSAIQPTPIDSLTFREGAYYTEIAHAPPGFTPHHQKLDYQILLLEARTLTPGWIEVVMNTETGETAWVRRHDVSFQAWEDFLLGVYDVEVQNAASNPLRSGPTPESAEMGTAENQSLRPLAIQGNWMQVMPIVDGQVDGAARPSWIRWRDEDGLLVRYSLLS